MANAKSRVIIYTDGGCSPNPGLGGWAAVLISPAHGNRERELYGAQPDSTNNRMELTAVIEALRALNRPCRVVAHVDSRYVMNGVTSWMAGWKRNGWKTAARKPVLNQDLWQALDTELARHEIRWVWVKGHAGDPGNERADALANQGVPSS